MAVVVVAVMTVAVVLVVAAAAVMRWQWRWQWSHPEIQETHSCKQRLDPHRSTLCNAEPVRKTLNKFQATAA